METKKSKPLQDFRMSLHGLPYDKTIAAQPPIKVTSTKQLKSDPNSASLGFTSGLAQTNGLEKRRDSGSTAGTRSRKQSIHNESRVQSFGAESQPHQLGKTSTRNSEASLTTNGRTASSLTTAPSVPQIRIDDDPIPRPKTMEGDKDAAWPLTDNILPPHNGQTEPKPKPKPQSIPAVPTTSFRGLTLDLGGGLGDELQVSNMKFSQRGSMFIDGRKASQLAGLSTGSNRLRPGPQRIVTSSSVPETASPRIMSTDEETLSDKVRSFYAAGADLDDSSIANRMGNRWQHTVEAESDSMKTNSRHTSVAEHHLPSSPSGNSFIDTPIVKEDNELAGGFEDWQDVDNADVDRYGFITPRDPPPIPTDASKLSRSGTVTRPGMQRVSTSLQVASESPRRKHALRRAPSSAHSERNRTQNRRDSDPSIKSNKSRPGTSRSVGSTRASVFRSKDHRLMNDAADMFTLPRSLTAESNTLTRTTTNDSNRSSTSQPAPSKMASSMARRKEVEREEKWRKMARPIPAATSPNQNTKIRSPQSIGTTLMFSFPPLTDPKLVSRTWKGIPDSWRAQAWHYFLSVSAAKDPKSLTDDRLINLYHEYQDLASPDDVQIDIDVPRTINAHIMFRRRYRGGQRLLFRVLHAMSLYWPDTGYVQGMAALAATLLAYYEEEKAFVMLVRLWDVRGLGRLYESGFGGLMEALDHFEKDWLGNGEVAKKLNEVNIFPTAYGTKWYLTLFNYSIPFPAQLRVWDVFMLLGDDSDSLLAQSKPTPPPPPPQQQASNGATNNNNVNKSQPLGTTLDILHATSAALIDGMRDILLESDFENAMKVLTSWIPIRDEDLFMRVAKAEYKIHRKKGS